MDGNTEAGFIAGRLQMMTTSRIAWADVCADSFTQIEAAVVCREIGYDQAQLMAPGSFGTGLNGRVITNLTCKGSEETLKDCDYSMGWCKSGFKNFANILCNTKDADPSKCIHVM